MARSSRAVLAATRRRLVEEAGVAFRQKGYAGVAVRDLMADVGLSHGAFYGHFASKEALFGEACREAMAGTRARMQAKCEGLAAPQGLEALVAHYLHPWHAAHPEEGCCLPALGGEAPRLGEEGQGPLREAAKAFQRDLLPLVGGSEEVAWATLATMVGALVLARAVGLGPEGEAVLKACQTQAIRGAKA